VYYGGDLHTYRVIKTFEVKPSDVSVLDQPTNKRIATLMTCTPIGTTLRRLIVQSEEVDPDTGKALKVGERAPTDLNPGKLPELPI
jgi:LPXTG-site transpeptidase (sortase) family protein